MVDTAKKTITLNLVHGKGTQSVTASSEKLDLKVGRHDAKTKVDLDLGKESACSRETGSIKY
jgi:hypothetical protein